MIIRAFSVGDADAVTAIYRHHVLTGTATFEEQAPTTEEMLRRLSGLTKTGFPVLVACTPDDTVLGFAYAGPTRPDPPIDIQWKILFMSILNAYAKELVGPYFCG